MILRISLYNFTQNITKRSTRIVILVVTFILLLIPNEVMAQTYAQLTNGVWYSVVETAEHTMGNNYDLDLKYPSSEVNFDAKYQTGSAFSPKLRVDWYNGNSWTENLKTISDLSKNYKNYSITNLSPSATKIAFVNAGGTLKRYVKNIYVKMAPHIILNTTSINLGDIVIGESTEASIDFYSFLTKDAMTASCDIPGVSFDNLAGTNECEKIDENKHNVTVKFNPQTLGAVSGTITLNNGVNSVNVSISANVVKKNQTITWPDANLRKIKVGNTLTAPAATDAEGLELTYTSDNTEIIAIENGNVLVPVSEGKANITVTNEGNDIYNAVSSTVEFEVTYKEAQAIAWTQDFTNLMIGDDDITLTATSLTNNIIFTSDNEQVVKIINNSILKIVGVGTANITASDAGNDTYAEATYTKTAIVAPINDGCSANFLINDANGFNNSFEFSAPGDRLTLSVAWESFSTGSVKVIDVTNNQEITSFNATGNSWSAGTKELTATVSRNCRSIKFEVGNKMSISNIKLTQASYFEADNTPIEFGELIIGEENTKTATFYYSHKSNNIKAQLQSVLDKETSPFTVSQEIFENSCGQSGENTIAVTFTAQEGGSFNDQLVLSTGSDTIRIDLTATALHIDQEITWGDTAEISVGERVENPATASSQLEIIYTSSDSTVIAIEGNTLIALKAGVAEITATQAGNEIYNAASATQTFTVNRKAQNVTVSIDAPENFYVGMTAEISATTTSGLTDFSYTTESDIISIEGNIITAVAPGTAKIFAVQAGNENEWLEAKDSIEITVIAKLDQTITWSETSEFIVGERVENPATASSELEIIYTSSDSTVIAIEGNTLIALKAGVAEITATQAGNEIYNAASATQTFTVNRKAQSVTVSIDAPEDFYVGMTAEISATATSGLTDFSYTTESDIISIEGNIITALAPGTAKIFAVQAGNENEWLEAKDSIEITVIAKLDQTITWEEPFELTEEEVIENPASASSGLEIAYTSSDSTVINIVNNSLIALKPGFATITATQVGDNEYNAVTSTQEFKVKAISTGGDITTDLIVVGDNLYYGNLTGTLRVIDIAGRIIYSTNIDTTMSEISLSHLPKGVYIISLGNKTTKMAVR